MNASDLRIGNWYNEFSIPKQVTPKFILKLSEIESKNKTAIDISPIPLTEEWLNKFGFSIGASESQSAYYHKKVGIYNFCIRIYRDRIGFSFCMGHEDNSSYETKHYVHQLQNLYFALTGEELTINE